MIGTGKESDVYIGVAGETAGIQNEQIGLDATKNRLVDPGIPVVVKFHRLGRTSFRKVKEKREYHQHRNTCSWLYLDRLASQREFTMMKVNGVWQFYLLLRPYMNTGFPFPFLWHTIATLS